MPLNLLYILKFSPGSNIFIIYMVVFLAGIVTSLTPCVYPMIPIIAGFIGARQEASTLKNFLLSLSYVIGMAVAFSILGAFASFTGKLFGQIQTSPIAHIIVGNIIILFGLATLGVFTMPNLSTGKLPVNIAKGIFGAFILGFASGFVAIPCTSAVLGAVLVYVASKQNVIFGISLLFTFAMGVGVLLILIGTFTGLLNMLPKSGNWLLRLQKAFGFFLIGLGEYFLIKAGMLLI